MKPLQFEITEYSKQGCKSSYYIEIIKHLQKNKCKIIDILQISPFVAA